VQAATTRDAATDRVFLIPSGVTVTLKDLTIRYGRATNFPLRLIGPLASAVASITPAG
jgi:hypothetical protein